MTATNLLGSKLVKQLVATLAHTKLLISIDTILSLIAANCDIHRDNWKIPNCVRTFWIFGLSYAYWEHDDAVSVYKSSH